MMEKKAFVRFIILFLGFSYLLISCAAVPTTRSLKSNKDLPSSVQDVMKLSDAEADDARMLMESTDYPGTGANKNHDPKTPGRA